MKKIIALTLAILMIAVSLVFVSCDDKKNELVVYTEAGFAPYEFVYNNEIVGVDIEIMKAVAAEMGKTLVIKDVDFNGIVAAVQSGKCDAGAAGITIRDDRKESVDFSIPYSSTEQYVIVTTANAIPTVEDLKGKNIGVQQGTTSDFMIEELMTKDDKPLEGSTLTPYTTPALAAAAIGKIDAVVTDKLTAEIIVANNSGLKCDKLLKADGSPAAEVEEYGIAVRKGNKELLDTVNKVLEKLIADGTIDKWTQEFNEKAKDAE